MKKLFAVVLSALLLALPGALTAQTYPVYENTFVNDYAQIIEDGAEGRITTALRALRDETGVEATVLTIYTRWGYESSGSLESFATGLFNSWGIGNAETNDGILILVVSEDREMRVELGAGYPAGYSDVAQEIIDRSFLPAFRDGDFSTGIEDGTGAVIERIARAHYAGQAPEPRSGGVSGGLIGAIVGGLFALILGAVVFGRRISDRVSKCPQCGERGIHSARTALEEATKTATGRGQKVVTCPHCGYSDTTIYTIPMLSSSSSSSSSFGGGSSSGGGASGRW